MTEVYLYPDGRLINRDDLDKVFPIITPTVMRQLIYY